MKALDTTVNLLRYNKTLQKLLIVIRIVFTKKVKVIVVAFQYKMHLMIYLQCVSSDEANGSGNGQSFSKALMYRQIAIDNIED